MIEEELNYLLNYLRNSYLGIPQKKHPACEGPLWSRLKFTYAMVEYDQTGKKAVKMKFIIGKYRSITFSRPYCNASNILYIFSNPRLEEHLLTLNAFDINAARYLP